MEVPTVLVVDDDVSLRGATVRLLKAMVMPSSVDAISPIDIRPTNTLSGQGECAGAGRAGADFSAGVAVAAGAAPSGLGLRGFGKSCFL